MKTTTLALALLALGWMSACKKDPPKQYSYWTVNGDSFRTNDVTMTTSKVGSSLRTNAPNEEFNFGWGIGGPGGLPTGNFPIFNTSPTNPTYVFIKFWYKGQFYIVSQDLQDTLLGNLVNGKVQYQLNRVWFKNINDSTDTVLINGTFNQP